MGYFDNNTCVRHINLWYTYWWWRLGTLASPFCSTLAFTVAPPLPSTPKSNAGLIWLFNINRSTCLLIYTKHYSTSYTRHASYVVNLKLTFQYFSHCGVFYLLRELYQALDFGGQLDAVEGCTISGHAASTVGHHLHKRHLLFQNKKLYCHVPHLCPTHFGSLSHTHREILFERVLQAYQLIWNRCSYRHHRTANRIMSNTRWLRVFLLLISIALSRRSTVLAQGKYFYSV